jgi:hypothetical protein
VALRVRLANSKDASSPAGTCTWRARCATASSGSSWAARGKRPPQSRNFSSAANPSRVAPEKCLWRLLYETAARAQEVLSADVTDLDLENKRLRVRRKGGDSDWLHFQSGSARLLPRLIGDRDAGPIFLTDRRPGPGRAPASLDLCPITGLAGSPTNDPPTCSSTAR